MKNLTCATAHERLMPFVDGALADADARGLELHLRGCEACRAELERTRALVTTLGARQAEPPIDVDAAWLAFQERLESRGGDAPVRAWWRSWWLLPVPVAALAGAALAVVLLRGPSATDRPDEVRLVQHLDLLEAFDCLVELPTLESAGLLADPSEIERALEEVGG